VAERAEIVDLRTFRAPSPINRPEEDQSPPPAVHPAIASVRRQAGERFGRKGMMCSESVFTVLNESFGGSLGRREAVALSAPFSEGIGGSGCICGALAGGLLSLGLLLDGRTRLNRRASRRWGRELHERFRRHNGSTCCRRLTRTVIHDAAARHAQCAQRTADTAAMAAALLLEARPDLARRLAPPPIVAEAPGVFSRIAFIPKWFRLLFRRS